MEMSNVWVHVLQLKLTLLSIATSLAYLKGDFNLEVNFQIINDNRTNSNPPPQKKTTKKKNKKQTNKQTNKQKTGIWEIANFTFSTKEPQRKDFLW